MSSKFEINNIVEGTVTDIKPFGAFIALDEKTKGLVHISQISHNFINDINEHISVGDKVKVKIIGIDESSKKISLSIKATTPNNSNYKNRDTSKNRDVSKHKSQPKFKQPSSLEDKLKDWLKESDERQSVLNKRNKRR
ncbi:CvfD/Ygs/GSP13 family RNA-binding post-transcriptional regulator [Tepidibacter formicigenes]|jgi:general stress protein 13|uniref:General stress protein 13 n=1 Tax=Tepidibacter formicigenes DSM 15518 TaxID=1123349 RepID=A0A1M6SXN7_9FIRM|nr:CvfD/Ygs/GSP13 family RNA-binding post-transcriptional regulator [Tepidibacter formicigenes]SHK49410.1 general stress protein 13 [Tepidibacter formicigenes DSM 15518]